MTIGLGILQSSVVISVANNQLFQGCSVDPIPNAGPLTYVLAILTMTAGTGLHHVDGRLITERGVGQGMSILIFTGIAASFPSMLLNVSQSSDGGWWAVVLGSRALLAITVVVSSWSRASVVSRSSTRSA